MKPERRSVIKCVCLVLTFLFSGGYSSVHGQWNKPDSVAGIPVNYDESKAGSYVLDDPLTLANGEKVKDAETWMNVRRPELLELFYQFEYGFTPEPRKDISFDVFEKGSPALDGKAIRKQVTVSFSAKKDGPEMDVLIYLPADVPKPVPVIISLGFTPNSSRVDDPNIKPGEYWDRESQERVPVTEETRRWSFDEQLVLFLSRGIGVAMVYYGDIEPDFPEGITKKKGVRNLYLKEGQQKPAPNEWGAISAWAWGLSRVVDYLETDEEVDPNKIAVTGASRLGKTVLWAAARDQRFDMVIACCSGAGGAALNGRDFGESIAHLTAPSRYPYQFAENFQMFADYPKHIPVDGHLLLSLIAPRPVLLQTGNQDLWLDPKGEFLAALAAGPVYELFGEKGLETEEMPPAEIPILNTIGYYMHEGGHGPNPSDWDIYVEFMEKHFNLDDEK
ncbi:alpha/beta hydrolase family protein [Gracilimonas mengyeensis]|uniref:4-O-methyl-glucuronoyl methylesterase-like domain-containing protein n=1 Tax=Gracilimonas mengyeensis TaxID=1302730 RepID=A0A521C330_9BACT|nr:S9 family peptidase [Gracilimonas mengyeensis]SMO53896.1 hypothetical protein SAMN06265219_104118 [Gracilimonas mengyeensis]